MKNKALILAGFFAFSLCAWKVEATIPQQVYYGMESEDNHIPSGAEKIELLGKLDYNAGPDDIEAGATENAVYIYFNQNFGNVSIMLYDASSNLLYNNVVDTSVQQLVVIPISSTVCGNCTVVISNANGYVEGGFEHN